MTARMLTLLEFNNFRGFSRLRLDNLSRVNLAAGKNNTGKTAPLEGIFLQLGPLQPQLATSFSHRGEGGGTSLLPIGLRYSDEWQSLFLDREINNPIELSCEIGSTTQQKLTISLREAKVETIQSSGKGTEST